MDISLRLANNQEINLKPIRFSNKPEESNIYSLVPLDEDTVYMRLKLDDNKLSIIDKDNRIVESEEILTYKLDELFLELIESIQSGTEDNEGEITDENPYDPELIRVDTKNFSLRQIYDMINNNDIDLSPDFQRNFVWDSKRKSRLIESILLRIPLPMFYFSQDIDGKITVVDGLQRLSTIRDFMNNELKLKNLEYLNCEGKYYKTKIESESLEPKYFRWFNMTQIVVNIIDPQSPTKVKYDIFRRINTGGKPLNSQEIRNCLSSINLRNILRSMYTMESYKKATLGSIRELRMESQEIALRFIYFLRLYDADPSLENYNGKIETGLDNLVDILNNLKLSEIEKYVVSYDNAMKNAEYLFGKYAFRKCRLEHLQPDAKTQLINKALLVSWSVLLSKYDPKFIKDNLKQGSLALPLSEKISKDNDLFMFLTYSTNAKTNIQAAFKAAEEIINQNLKIK